jgi:hypothetical protein
LALYQKANSSAPNRAINTLGIARAYSQLHNYTEATKLYRILLTQLTSSNDTDAVFTQEVMNSITKNKGFFLS